MPRTDNQKSGCSVTTGLLLLVIVLAALGVYFIWRVNSTGYTAGPCLEAKTSDCSQPPTP